MALVFSFASESLAQSTASFPAAANTSTPAPAAPAAPAPSAPRPAPSAPAAVAPAAAPAAPAPPQTPKHAPPPAAPSPSLPAPVSASPATEPAPNFASGFYPPLLPYRAGLPVPPGYRVEHRSANGLIGGGLASLLIAYTTAIVIGASADFKDGTGWLIVPVVGPWAAIGARSYHCANDPLLANQCVSGAFSEVQTMAILSADAVVQATGAVLLIVGVASGHDELVRSDLAGSVRIAPRSVGTNGFGVGLDGRF